MHRTLTTVFLAGMVISHVSAQMDSASFAAFYEKETVFFNGYRLLYNGFEIKPGPQLFDFSPAGLSEYQNSIRSRRRFLVTYAAAAGLLAGSIVARDERNSALLLAGSTVSLSFCLHFMVRSGKQFNKSIWLRNRDALKRKF